MNEADAGITQNILVTRRHKQKSDISVVSCQESDNEFNIAREIEQLAMEEIIDNHNEILDNMNSAIVKTVNSKDDLTTSGI